MIDTPAPKPFRLGLYCGWLTDGEKKRCGTKLAEIHVNGTAVVTLPECPRCGARNEFEWGSDGVRLVKVVPPGTGLQRPTG